MYSHVARRMYICSFPEDGQTFHIWTKHVFWKIMVNIVIFLYFSLSYNVIVGCNNFGSVTSHVSLRGTSILYNWKSVYLIISPSHSISTDYKVLTWICLHGQSYLCCWVNSPSRKSIKAKQTIGKILKNLLCANSQLTDQQLDVDIHKIERVWTNDPPNAFQSQSIQPRTLTNVLARKATKESAFYALLVTPCTYASLMGVQGRTVAWSCLNERLAACFFRGAISIVLSRNDLVRTRRGNCWTDR